MDAQGRHMGGIKWNYEGEGSAAWEGNLHGIHSSPFMKKVMRDIARRFSHLGVPVVPLLLALWRDGVSLSKKNSIYPVCVMIMNVAEALRRCVLVLSGC